jgi:hypothetical protein
VTGFPTEGSAIPASGVPSAKGLARPREQTLRAFLAGERVTDAQGRAWPRAEAMLDSARRELAEIEAQHARAQATEDQRREAAALPPCPWCQGERVPTGDRYRCTSCSAWLGVQVAPIQSTGPQSIVFFFAPAKTR